jgi:hypothetical protein
MSGGGYSSSMPPRIIFFMIAVLTLTLSPEIPATSASVAKIQIQAITDSKPGEVEITFLSQGPKSPKSMITSYQIVAKPVGASGLGFSKSYSKKVSGYISQKVSPLSPGVDYIFTLTQRSVDKKVTRSTPYAYTTEPTSPSAPRITSASATDSDEAVIFFDAPINDGGTPILSYTVTANPGQIITTSNQQVAGSITAIGLTKATSYTFTITAQNLYGSSEPSLISPAVTTLAQKIVRVSPASTTQTNTVPPLAAPAFTISSVAETRVATTALVGYTITSSGGAIASYSLTGTLPAGLSFSTSTGLITGTPTETKTATTYTITATNASGSASNNYRLRVTGDIGDDGPGGGKIFYYSAAGFNCGPTRAATCKYLEAAPPALGLATFDSDTANTTSRTWAQNTPVNYQLTTVNNATSPETATATALGWGYRNTRAIILQGNTNPATSAAALADSHTVTVSGVVYDDWYLPSTDELNQMCKWARGITGVNLTNLAKACTGGALNTGPGAAGFAADFYWSSTENDSFSSLSRLFTNGSGAATNKNVSEYVRAIRAF